VGVPGFGVGFAVGFGVGLALGLGLGGAPDVKERTARSSTAIHTTFMVVTETEAAKDRHGKKIEGKAVFVGRSL